MAAINICNDIGAPNPASKARGSGWEEQPHIQGAVAARVQEGPRSYSTFKVRRCSSEEISLFKVRSSSCALLEQP